MSNVIVSKITKSGDTGYFASQAFFSCMTGASTAAKVATSSSSASFTDTSLVQGMTIHVEFSNTNTASSPTLKVGDSTAKPIRTHGTTSPGTSASTSWLAGSVLTLTYDGTAWILNDWQDTSATTSTENSYINVDLAGPTITGGMWTASSSTLLRSNPLLVATSVESFVLTAGSTWSDQYYFVRLAGTPFTASGIRVARYIDVRENLLGIVSISNTKLSLTIIKNNSSASLPSTSSAPTVRLNYLVDLAGDSGGDLNDVM